MSGILGTVNKTIEQEALDLIKHRGPNSNGIKSFKVRTHDVWLSMTRLAIVELSEAGHQPMVSFCGNYALIFDGEIYNHLDLRPELSDIAFRGSSSAETALYYLIKFGIEGIGDFNGVFGFSFLDIRKNQLYIARDQFGVKPVYWSANENGFLFSSEIRPLIHIMEEISIERDNLPTLLHLRYLPAPLTPYRGINKLRPGHYLNIDLNGEEIIFQETNFVDYTIKSLPENISQVAEYGRRIEKAVKRQLISDVEVGVLLSGGIDSAVVAALAQKNSSSSLKAFTIGFDGNHIEDEIEAAKETAELLGLDHYSKKINFENFLAIFKETTRIIEEPLATTSVIPMYYLAQLASQHVKVVLTGQGADEPLGGYQRYQGELISEFIPRGAIRISSKLLPYFQVKNETLLRASHSLGEKNNVERFLKVYAIFQQHEIKKLLNVEDKQAYELVSYFYDLQKRERITPVERMMAIDLKMNLADDLLLYTDKLAMNFSLECRVPMLDAELISYIQALPLNQRLKFRKTKIIHKEFADKILPSRIVNRKKIGFKSPTQIWFKTHNEQIRTMLLSPGIFTEIFNSDAIQTVLDLHLKGYNKEKQIFLLLGIYYWLENVEYQARDMNFEE